MTSDSHLSKAPSARWMGWSAPHLLGGRGRTMLIVAGILIVVGALTDTVAFKAPLDLLLREPELLSWFMAAGATCMALMSAASLGVALAVRRRHDTSFTSFAVAATVTVWLGLGTAMFLVRWLDKGSVVPLFGTTPTQATQPTLLIALFFAAVYVISGACTIFEAERLHNPEYAAYQRLSKLYNKQVVRTADAEATVDRARSAVDHHSGELDREDHRRIAAITARKALGSEAANYARLLMAALMRDPAKTGITETGPVPELPSP